MKGLVTQSKLYHRTPEAYHLHVAPLTFVGMHCALVWQTLSLFSNMQLHAYTETVTTQGQICMRAQLLQAIHCLTANDTQDLRRIKYCLNICRAKGHTCKLLLTVATCRRSSSSPCCKRTNESSAAGREKHLLTQPPNIKLSVEWGEGSMAQSELYIRRPNLLSLWVSI